MSMTTGEFRTRVHDVIQDIIRDNIERILYLNYIDSYDNWDLLVMDLKHLTSEFFSDAYRIAAYAGNAQKIANREEKDHEYRLSKTKPA